MKVGIYLKKDHPVYVTYDDDGNVISIFDQISIDRTIFIGIVISIIIGIGVLSLLK